MSRGIVVQKQDNLAEISAAFFLYNVLQFAIGIFWVGVRRYAATPLIVALSPGHSDITRFLPWSPIATDHLDRAEIKKFQTLLRRLAPLTFMIRVQAFRDPLRRELPHVQIFMNYGPNPLT